MPRRSVILMFSGVFLFSQINIPQNILSQKTSTTYDYVVNLGRFSVSEYSVSYPENLVKKFFDLYSDIYFDKIKKIKKVGKGKKRRYIAYYTLKLRNTPKTSLLAKVRSFYDQVKNTDFIFRDEATLMYTDTLISAKNYTLAEKILLSLSNSTTWDEALILLMKLSYINKNYDKLRDYVLNYLDLKKKDEIYSKPFIIYSSILDVIDGNVGKAIDKIHSIVKYDFTKNDEYVSDIIEFFTFLKSQKLTLSENELLKTLDISFMLSDYKMYDDAVRLIGTVDKTGIYTAELLLELKARKVKISRYTKILNPKLRKIVTSPLKYEKAINTLQETIKPIIYKSLFVHYSSINKFRAYNYLTNYVFTTKINHRVFSLINSYIDKLILLSDFESISLILDNSKLSPTGALADRYYFIKGYALEKIGSTNKAIEFYEKSIFANPSGYYDFLSSRRISEIASEEKLRSYKQFFSSPNYSEEDKLNLAKVLYSFDDENKDTYKSYIIYKLAHENKFLLDIPYEIFEYLDKSEKEKLNVALFLIKDLPLEASRFFKRKLEFKGISSTFSSLILMRNRLENKITKGIYLEGNSLTSNKFISTYAKFLPFSIQEVIYPIPYVSEVIEASSKFDIDPNLIYAVMKQESHFQEMAYSRAGAIGLMQVLYSTGKLVDRKFDEVEIDSRKDLFNIDVNIMVGTAYIYMLMNTYGDLHHAISAYNGGARVFAKTKKKYKNYNLPIQDSIIFSEFLAFRETRNYIKKVIEYYNVYSSVYNFKIGNNQN